jgi:hypothetical protein
MRTTLLIATAATAALIAGAASAQMGVSNFGQPVVGNSMPLPAGTISPGNLSYGDRAPSYGRTPNVSVGDVAPAAAQPAERVPAPSVTTPPPAPDTSVNPPAAGAPRDTSVNPAASAPVERAPAATVGGTEVISSGPVPDTAANRAKYGQPMSTAGRMTRPAGN